MVIGIFYNLMELHKCIWLQKLCGCQSASDCWHTVSNLKVATLSDFQLHNSNPHRPITTWFFYIAAVVGINSRKLQSGLKTKIIKTAKKYYATWSGKFKWQIQRSFIAICLVGNLYIHTYIYTSIFARVLCSNIYVDI